MKVFLVCYGLAEARSNTVQHHIDKVVIHYFGIDIESINNVQVFLYRTCLSKITNLSKGSAWLIPVVVVFFDGILDLFPNIVPMPVSFPPFQQFSFYT